MKFLGFLVLGACATAAPGTQNEISLTDAATTHDGPQQQQHADASQQPAGPCSFSGALATWDMSGQTGSETMVASASAGTGIVAGQLTRATGLTATSGAGSINASNWPTGGVDTTKYYAFTVAPPSGCSLKVTGIAVDIKASGSGPANGAIATSADQFASTTSVNTAAPSTATMTVTSSGMLEVRVYGSAATATSGTMRIQNTLTVNGQLQ